MVTQYRKGNNMSRITKTDKYAIQWLVSQDMEIDNISSELNLTKKQINNFLKTVSDESIESSSEKKKSNIINKTFQQGRDGIAIMTKEASEQYDVASKKHRDKSAQARGHSASIFRPKS